MGVILDIMKMYKPTLAGPTVRKMNLAERSKHNTVFCVPQIPENNPNASLSPHDSFANGKVQVYRANTFDHIPSDPNEFGADFYESRFGTRAEAMKQHALNVQKNLIGNAAEVVQANHFIEYAIAANAAATKLGLPLVYQIHAPLSGFISKDEKDLRAIRKNQFKIAMEQAMFHEGKYSVGGIEFNLKRPDHIIAISELTKQFLIGAYGLNDNQITVVVNGLASHEMADRQANKKKIDEFYSEHNISREGTLNIAHVGTLDKINGVHNLLAAIEKVNQGGNKIHLTLVGPDRGVVEDFKGKDWLTYMPRLDQAEVQILYQGADLMAMPRIDMGAADVIDPLKPAEAAKNGAGLLLSDNPALRERFGDCAIMVKPGDVGDLEAKLKDLSNTGIDKERLDKTKQAISRYPLWEDSTREYDLAIDKAIN